MPKFNEMPRLFNPLHRYKFEFSGAEKKAANEKLVAKYREKKKAEMAEKKKREREKQLEVEQAKNEQLQEKRIQSARARTKWQKTRAKQYQEGLFSKVFLKY